MFPISVRFKINYKTLIVLATFALFVAKVPSPFLPYGTWDWGATFNEKLLLNEFNFQLNNFASSEILTGELLYWSILIVLWNVFSIYYIQAFVYLFLIINFYYTSKLLYNKNFTTPFQLGIIYVWLFSIFAISRIVAGHLTIFMIISLLSFYLYQLKNNRWRSSIFAIFTHVHPIGFVYTIVSLLYARINYRLSFRIIVLNILIALLPYLFLVPRIFSMSTVKEIENYKNMTSAFTDVDIKNRIESLKNQSASFVELFGLPINSGMHTEFVIKWNYIGYAAQFIFVLFVSIYILKKLVFDKKSLIYFSVYSIALSVGKTPIYLIISPIFKLIPNFLGLVANPIRYYPPFLLLKLVYFVDNVKTGFRSQNLLGIIAITATLFISVPIKTTLNNVPQPLSIDIIKQTKLVADGLFDEHVYIVPDASYFELDRESKVIYPWQTRYVYNHSVKRTKISRILNTDLCEKRYSEIVDFIKNTDSKILLMPVKYGLAYDICKQTITRENFSEFRKFAISADLDLQTIVEGDVYYVRKKNTN